MKFRDKIERSLNDETYVIRKYKTDAVYDHDINVLRQLPQTDDFCFCKTLIKHVRLDEAIFDQDGIYLSYRTE